MTQPMTAQELYEIVKDVPREAWPYVQYHDESQVWTSTVVCHAGWDVELQPALAEAAFVGAMVRHLKRKGYKVEIDVDDTIWLTGPYPTETRRHIKTGPTLIEALAAACKAKKQEDDDGN